MSQDELKALVAQAAIAYVEPDTVIGVGTGSTANHFIDALGKMPRRIKAAVSSSQKSTARMQALGLSVLDANQVEALAIYVDGADEIDRNGCMLKGGGGALTREKIVADLAARFICIVDESKFVNLLGRFPLPVEVIPMAAAQIGRRLKALGGDPVLRENVITDNGGQILDVRGLQISNPEAMEREINQWPGVISVGIFARNRADVCLLGTNSGVRTIKFTKTT